MGVLGTFCPPLGVLLLQKEERRNDLLGYTHRTRGLWRPGGVLAPLGGPSRRRLTPHIHEPAIRGSWLGRRTIRLTLPLDALLTMGQHELDVLLATGLAPSISTRTSTYTPGRLLLAGLVLLACLTLIVCWMHHVLPVGIPLALALWAVVVWCWQRQARSLAFHADTLMVRWLGRSHACSGLHTLAERRPASRRGHWGEPSLAERIERVCGTPVEARENRLTLVG
jgi:hypothetical protein